MSWGNGTFAANKENVRETEMNSARGSSKQQFNYAEEISKRKKLVDEWRRRTRQTQNEISSRGDMLRKEKERLRSKYDNNSNNTKSSARKSSDSSSSSSSKTSARGFSNKRTTTTTGKNGKEGNLEERYEYWKNFWQNIQSLRSKFDNDEDAAAAAAVAASARGGTTAGRRSNAASHSNKTSAAPQSARGPSSFKQSPPPKPRGANFRVPLHRRTTDPTTADTNNSKASSNSRPTRNTSAKRSQQQQQQQPQTQKELDPTKIVPQKPKHLDPNSNVAKFWSEENERKQRLKPAMNARKAAHKQAAVRSRFRAPSDADAARDMWAKMKQDVESQWNKYKASDNVTEDERNALDGNVDPEEILRQEAMRAAAEEEQEQQQRQSPPTPVRAASESVAPKTPLQPPSPAPRQHSTEPSSSSYANVTGYKENVGIRTAPQNTGNAMEKMSVRQLKELLGRYRVPTAGCIDKEDMIVRFRTVMEGRKKRVQREQKREETRAAEVQKEQVEGEIKTRVLAEVKQWAHGKTIHNMLNDVNQFNSPSKTLKRNHSFTPVSKAYKRALLKIHPDKHMASGDYAQHVRATEMFKLINQAYTEFKNESDKKKEAQSARMPSSSSSSSTSAGSRHGYSGAGSFARASAFSRNYKSRAARQAYSSRSSNPSSYQSAKQASQAYRRRSRW